MDNDLRILSSKLNGTAEDEQKAVLLLKKYHSLVYHLFRSDHHWNISVIQKHCTIPNYYQQHIMTAATASDGNERILTFLEDTFLQSGKCDEFFIIVHKLVEMPSALPIIEKMQKELNSTFKRKAMMTASTSKEPYDNNSRKMRSAKRTMTNVISTALCSIPGYDILESYRDHICTSLPDDYNNTAMRLQTLIGASDHMIQWILTGDVSKVNHRIYQVVLVFVCFEPHFIKFCDIMEVLAADSITSGYIVELRKTLIKQLYTDGHITAKEASELTSRKLFKVPVATSSFPTINAAHNITMTMMTSSSFNAELCTSTVRTTTTFSVTVKLNNTTAAVAIPSIAILDRTLPQNTCALSNSQCATEEAFGTEEKKSLNTTVTSDIITVASNKVLHQEQYENNTVTISSLKNTVSTNEMNDPHQVPVVSSESNIVHARSAIMNASLSVHDVKEDSTIEASGVTLYTLASKDNKPSLPVPLHTESSNIESSGKQSNLLSTDNNDTHQSQISIANSEAFVSICSESADDTSDCGNQVTYTSVLSKQDESLTIVASSDSVVNSIMQPDPLIDTSTLEFGSKEVCDILKAKDFAIVKDKYTDILSCFPENYEATIGCLQSHLSDSDICEVLSMTSGQNQKLLDFLILKLKSKEDLLDCCDNLEKIDGALPSLKTIVEELRKDAIEIISNSGEPSQTGATSVVHPAKPLRKIIPFHSKLLEMPKATEPFDVCLLAEDSIDIVALKKCYPILLDNLPSNHLISLVRLQDVAILPEEIVDTIVPSPSAEIGNKLIINYLIGLICTEEHIITFCYFAERMLGEFDKCICVLNLRNTMLMSQECEVNNANANKNATIAAEQDKPFNVFLDISCDWLKTQYADEPSIRALIKVEKNDIFYQPFSHGSGSLIGYSKCIIINSHGHNHDGIQTISDVKVTTDEDSPSNDVKLVKDYLKKDYLKEYAFTLSGEQGIPLSKQQYFESIEIFFRESNRGGVMIYYTGWGEEGTGNWCFKDGVISLNDILSLYDKYLKDRLLVIYADCSYSGQWVLDYANALDEMGIEACGHQMRKQKKFLKIFTSCQPNQTADARTYVTKALNFSEEDDSLWVYTNLKLSDSQTTYGCNFSNIQCVNPAGPEAPCQLSKIPNKCSWNWKDIVDPEYKNRPSSRVFTVRGTDRGRKAWYIVLVEKDLLESFQETINSKTIDLEKFGYIIKSGYGKDPPNDLINNIKKIG